MAFCEVNLIAITGLGEGGFRSFTQSPPFLFDLLTRHGLADPTVSVRPRPVGTTGPTRLPLRNIIGRHGGTRRGRGDQAEWFRRSRKKRRSTNMTNSGL